MSQILSAPISPAPASTQRRIHILASAGGQHNQKHLHDFYDGKDAPLTMPPEGTPLLKSKVEILPGTEVSVYAWGDDIFVGNLWPWTSRRNLDTQEVDPFVTIRVTGDAKTKIVSKRKRIPRKGRSPWNSYGGYGYDDVQVDEPDNFCVRGSDYDGTGIYQNYLYLPIEVTAQGAPPTAGELRFETPRIGLAHLDPQTGDVVITGEFFGYVYAWENKCGRNIVDRQNRNRIADEDLVFCLSKCQLDQPKNLWWETWFKEAAPNKKFDTTRVKSVEDKKTIRPNLNRLAAEEPLLHTFFQFLHDKRTKDKGCNNTLLAAFLKECGEDYDKIVEALKDAMVFAETCFSSSYEPVSEHQWVNWTRPICKSLPGATDKVQEEAEKRDWSQRKTLMGQAEGLGIFMCKHPLLFKAVVDGLIPTSVFHQPDKTPVNREYAIWEKALARDGWAESICEIAASASRRGTYEKDMTPYLSFLFRLERYLDRHAPFKAGKKKGSWTAMPKFVSSQWELEMDEPSEDGTTKKRSAFTPVADNETHTITVPYVAVAVSGVRTQWCYSRFYHVFEEDMIDPESKSVVVRDLEPRLNGRDDYGLMYFTLTGTMTARGYPTFLIIFERLKAETRVHFHRVHPSRKRGENHGKTQACHMVEECYRYMAGNVRAEEIEAQQGDLLFIRRPAGEGPVQTGAKIADPVNVRSFESHEFIPHEGPALVLYANKAKAEKNRLGFLFAEKPFKVVHPEHENIEHLDAGFWEVRRCRSWEANPRAIWSLTID